MIKVGVLGTGKLGSVIIEALESGAAPECEFIGAASRSLGVSPLDLAEKGAEIIIEASKPEVLKQYLIPLLTAGVSVIPLSTGVFESADYRTAVEEAARRGHSRVYLPHGALGAFDLAATYGLRPEATATVVQYLPEGPGVPGNPMSVLPRNFSGTLMEGFRLLPSHLNVLMEAGIAAGGVERCRYETRTPEDGKGGFGLELETDLAKAVLRIANKPPVSGQSPMAGIALSTISLLNRITAPISF